ncbi:MAG: IclR family transcriptional regulator [Thiotrichales bacterium]|jgi:DNA-binding IclR family transcriptional regulator|nr:IclR family transcriptional regulator [Thiotrichales bacterium]MDP6163954.1 IclR family transcriptional regulator [Candidatus Thioglobus sp.]|tara:strand:- start:10092 stop:10781 length:690 start_codon:yes stop_codon:yes gene_type:complete
MKPRSIDKNYNAIEKCLQILSMYSLDKTEFSIKEICAQLNFNVSTAYRILCTLEEYGYVSRLKNKNYVIGTQALYLSAIYTQSNHLEQIRPIVDRIRDISGETSSFFVEEDDNRICLYRAHSRDEIRHNIEQGSRLELNRGASGRIILAYGKRQKDKKGFYKDIRDQGYYLSINEHNASLFALAVPVLSNSNKFVGALVVSGPVSRFDEQQKILLLNLLSKQLSNIVMP